MNGFINNLISRHTETNQNVQPRLPGIFEPGVIAGTISSDIDVSDAVRPMSLPGENIKMNPSNNVYPHNFNDQKSDDPFDHNPLINDPLLTNEYYNDQKIKEGPEEHSFRSGIQHQPGTKIIGPQKETSNINYNVKSADQKDAINYTDSLDKSGSLSTGIKTGFQELFPKQSMFRDFKNAHNQRPFNQTSKAEAPPVIKVTIGRIDVRAISQQTSLPVFNKAAPKPKMSLDDYLKKRDKGQ